MEIRRSGYALGAEIRGVDASGPLDETTVAAIRQAMLEHVVVYFPGQDLDPAQLSAFCRRFGELDLTENTQAINFLGDTPAVIVRSNKQIVAEGAQEIKRSPPADYWHSDFSFSRHPATYSFLLAKQLPSVGGDTMFANLYRAYDALSPAFRATIDPLQAVHDFSLGTLYASRGPEDRARFRENKPPVVHPVVRTHGETNRKALFVDTYIRTFTGMTEEETRPLLDFLIEHATRPEFIYRHRWTRGDLVVWDNRCSLHYAVQDYAAELRLMMRCSLVDRELAPTLDEVSGRTRAAAAGSSPA